MIDKERGLGMRACGVAISVLALGLGYAAAPYITLYRLDQALRTGDAEYVSTHVDWSSVRNGLVSQIDRAVTGQSAPAQDYSDLPAFGSGFVHGMATRMVDKAMEPDAMLSRIEDYALGGGAQVRPTAASVKPDAATPAKPEAPARALQWASFDGPTSFHVELSIGDDPAAQPVQIEMRLMGGQWRITGANVPPRLLMQAASRT
jgi:hypothetical protein